MSKNVTSLGIDLSLCNSGVVLLENGKIVEKKSIKSKPVGDKPIDELKRIQKIVSEIEEIVSEYNPNIAVIEGMAFMARNTTALVQLAALNYFTRAMLADYRVPFFVCVPTTLKRFALGKGNGEKDHMILAAYKEYGIDDIDNNIADALFLSKIGSALAGYEKVSVSYQLETIELLKKQLI